MCESNSSNLIDLSLEDEIPVSNTQIKTEVTSKPSEVNKPLFVSSNWHMCDSLENNPFDCVQKLANRQDNPFDIVEKEACLKARQVVKPQPEVKVANLLSLCDNLPNDKQILTPIFAHEEDEKFKALELDLESPPVMMNEKFLSSSTSGPESDANFNISGGVAGSAKFRKRLEYRKRLLKLSISNATFSSPLARKDSSEFEDVLGTPISSTLSRAAEFGENLLAAESPLKLVDDDLMSEEPSALIDSEKIFKADLEMLNIPILNELPSVAVDPFTTNSNTNSPETVTDATPCLESTLPNLETIKAKLKAKREKINNNHRHEISSLINNLKSLISSGEMVDNNKRKQASELLETLSLALKPATSKENLKAQELLTVPPQSIKRQGTFDIELQKNESINLESQPLVQEMPSCMISSSATYDGETTDDKQVLNLPEIAPLSPEAHPQHNDFPYSGSDNIPNHLQNDVNNIVEQLSKILINSSVDNMQNNPNPTFIVVMNTSQVNYDNSQQNTMDAKQRSGFVASYLEHSFNDGSPDLTEVNPMTRRRSQSLSIHDKIKIVHVPIQPLYSTQKQHSIQIDDSPPIITTPPSGDNEIAEFKTPARMVRRNSYSSGTPYTAQMGIRRTGFGSDAKNSTYLRKAQTLDTHHETQQQTIVRPISIASNNLPKFKPDIKKKTKHNTESILKSSVPLKATLPVKKFAPMLKTSPPTPDASKKLSSSFHNTSLHQSKTSRVPTTPMAAKERANTLGVGVGYPNACSTPAAFTSPLKRIEESINKRRYSYMSTTPNRKSISNYAASTTLKRRTTTEFKAKSPLKSRVSSVALAAIHSTSSKTSTSINTRISKTPAKINTASTSTVKPTGRLDPRISNNGSGLSTRNKENKRS